MKLTDCEFHLKFNINCDSQLMLLATLIYKYHHFRKYIPSQNTLYGEVLLVLILLDVLLNFVC
jgi:hypothetical protein